MEQIDSSLNKPASFQGSTKRVNPPMLKSRYWNYPVTPWKPQQLSLKTVKQILKH